MRSESSTIKIPKVAALNYYVKAPYARRVALNRENIFIRDHNICQYCGVQAESIDHIIPKSVYQIYVEDQNYQCFLHFKELLKSTLLLTTKKIREYAIKESIKNDSNSDYTYVEFGVFSGTTITFFSKHMNSIVVFLYCIVLPLLLSRDEHVIL